MSPASCSGYTLVLLGRQLREGRSTGGLRVAATCSEGWVSSLHLRPQKSVKRITFWSQQTWLCIPALLVLAVRPWTSYTTSLSLIVKTRRSSLPHWVIGEFNEIMTSSCEPDILRGLINVHVLCIKKRWTFLPCLCDRAGRTEFLSICSVPITVL